MSYRHRSLQRALREVLNRLDRRGRVLCRLLDAPAAALGQRAARCDVLLRRPDQSHKCHLSPQHACRQRGLTVVRTWRLQRGKVAYRRVSESGPQKGDGHKKPRARRAKEWEP